MTVSLRHAKTATGDDNPDRQISVSHWNANHNLTGTANQLLGFDGSGNATSVDPSTIAAGSVADGDKGEITISSGVWALDANAANILNKAQHVADRTALGTALTTNPVAYLRESGREGVFVWSSANNATNVTNDPGQGIYVPPASDTTGASGAWVRRYTGPANVKWFGALGNGTTDDTTALQRALDLVSELTIPAGTFIASSISVSDNTRIRTAGHDTILKQKSGTAANTRLVKIRGSNVQIDDIAVEGQLNQGGDTTGEQNHGIFIYIESTDTASRSNIRIGDVKGTNIRGDVVITGVHPTAYTAGYRLTGISVGKVIGSNVFRNVVSVTGGSDISVESVSGTQVGLYAFDAEPDIGSGPVTGLRIGYIKGRTCGFVSPAAGDYIEAEVRHIDLDPSYTTDSTPAYGATTYQHGLWYRNVKALRVDRLYANGHYGQAIKVVTGGLTRQTLSFGTVEIPTGCTTEATINGYINGDSATHITIGNLFATTTLSTHRVFTDCYYTSVEVANVALVTGSSYMRSCTDCSTGVLNMSVSGGGNGGTAVISGTRVSVNGGVQTGDYFFSFSTRCFAENVEATMASSYDNSGTNNYFGVHRRGGTLFYALANGLYQVSVTGEVQAVGGVISSATISGAAATTAMPTFRAPHGTAPSSPTNGDLWTTTAGAFWRINGATKTTAFLEGGAYTGTIVAPAATTSIASINIPHGTAPSSPTNGDVWTTTAGQFNRVNGSTLTVAYLTSALTPASVAATGAITSSGGGMGYATGAGGTVSQATSKSTGVTLSKFSGQITMNAAALAAGTIVSFVLTNTNIAATDLLILNHVSGGTPGSYSLNARCAAGSATIDVRNNTAGSLSEAIVIGFAVQKAVTA